MFQDRRMDDAEPLLLKLGVTLALPLAAYIISSLRFRTANGSSNNKEPPGSRCSLPATFVFGRGLKDALQVDQSMLSNGVALFSIIHGISTTPTTTSTILTSVENGISCEKSPCYTMISEIAEGSMPQETNQPSDPLCSPAIEFSDDEEGVLLQEDYLQQYDQGPAEAPTPVVNESSVPEATADGPVNDEPDNKEAEGEQEFAYLSKMFQSIWEMDILFQIQMLEFHGRKEHEDAVRDMENRLRMSELEVEHLQAKIDSLQKENEMLNLQASQFLRNVEEFESEKARSKHLKRKLKSARTQARAKFSSLEQRISMLQEKLQKMAQDAAEARGNFERLRGVEAEVAELRVRNLALSRKNLDLTRSLESAQTAAMSCSHETYQEANRPSEASGKLNKNEQLEADHFGDEEFMYLRWLSARLRDRTKKHVQLPWKTKDQSKRMSPESENKAAKLAFDSASECMDEKNLDMEYCYSPEGCDGTTIGKPSPKRDSGSKKPKLFRKFKKLLTRKSGENNKVSPIMAAVVDEHPSYYDDAPERGEYVSTNFYTDDVSGRCSSDSMASGFTVENSVRRAQSHEEDNWQNNSAWIQASYRSPRNFPKARRSSTEEDNKVAHCMSDLGASIDFMRTSEGGRLICRESEPKILGR